MISPSAAALLTPASVLVVRYVPDGLAVDVHGVQQAHLDHQVRDRLAGLEALGAAGWRAVVRRAEVGAAVDPAPVIDRLPVLVDDVIAVAPAAVPMGVGIGDQDRERRAQLRRR